jgi:uncharacterized protein Yka (UPF0111/DUF47 family)
MFSLQKLLGKDDEFFQLLESSAEVGHANVQALKRVVTDPSVTPQLEDFVNGRRQNKEITNRISQLLCQTFITTMEREDIEMLSALLYKIPKVTEKFAQCYILTGAKSLEIDLSRQVSMLEQAAETVLQMVKAMRGGAGLVKVAELNGRLQQIEGDADKLMLELLKDLYSGKHAPFKAVALKDLYELLEKIIDRTRDAGNAIYHVVLKYS